jgi:diguanylate cyclase
VAMYAAKRAKVGFAVYSPDRDHNSTARLTLMGDLRSALSAEDQLALHYQPKIDLRTGRVVGVEALLRWNHPVHGFMPPDAFIPLAEQTGMVTDLTQWVLDHAIGQVETWQRLRGGDPLPVALNLSARNLHEPDLAERVRVLLAHAHVSPASLEIEITESAIPADPGQAMTLIEELAALGVPVAIDDFGIGNTSISQLRSFPLRTLKIDRSFIAPLDSDPGSVVLVRAIVDLAHEFGITAVAEGVEAPAVATTLRDLGCDLAQGYLWSKAVPADEVLSLVERIDEGASAAHHQWSLA